MARPSSNGGDYQVVPLNLVYFFPEINWNLKANQIFSSSAEKNKFQLEEDQYDSRFSSFWLHPVRYQPDPTEPNTCRTVQVDNLPLNCNEKDVLSIIHHGKVESIQLVHMGRLRGLKAAPFKNARIVFTREHSASLFSCDTQKLTVLGQRIRVYQQLEPTYPRTPAADEAVYTHKMTRIISIPSFGLNTATVAAALRQFGITGLLELSSQEGKTVLEFGSILRAYKALQTLEIRGVKVEKESDYCNATVAQD